MTAPTAKAYDVTIYGATGYTGKLCVEYLVSHPRSSSFKWAIAGRSASKLQSLKDSYKLPASVGILQADNSVSDLAKSGLRELVSQSKVVLNLVGPYRLNGSYRLAELCAQEGTHYADLSGESDFNAQLQQHADPIAKKSGAILMPSSGYDSIPTDLATYLGVRRVRQLAAQAGLQVEAVEARSGNAIAGGASGGTLATMVSLGDHPETKWAFQPVKPFAIAGPASSKGTSRVHTPSLVRLPQFNAWGAFFPLGVHNGRVVYQSASHVDASSNKGPIYGSNFQYVDALVPVRGLPLALSWILASIVSTVAKSFLTLIMRLSLLRSFISWAVPPGTGPTQKQRETGYADLRSLVTAYPSKGGGQQARPVAAIGFWKSKKADPGYRMTSQLLCEVGIFLALDARQAGVPAGVRTAASLGDNGVDVFVKQLNERETFSVGVKDARPEEITTKRLVSS